MPTNNNDMNSANRRPNAQTREAYRLWFEYLKRAIREDEKKVRMDLYSEWGDVKNYSFDTWWDEIGRKVINLKREEVAQVKSGKESENFYLIRVPKSLTSTEIGNAVRRYLIQANHKPKQANSLRIKDGLQIRPKVYRAYLHTYDCYRELSGETSGKKITGREVLIAVRKFYIAREERYKNAVRRVDKLPSSLAANMDRNNLDKVDSTESAVAINAVNRYLTRAKKIINAVKKGRFPE